MSHDSTITIFRAGRHTDMHGAVHTFTPDDLEATARAYDPALHEAPLVVGHPSHDAPAYGWVGSLSAGGDALHAHPRQVDPAFAEMVANGHFKKVSASFYLPGAPNNPTPGGFYLRHVGFLGAQPPAVKGLPDASFGDGGQGVLTISFADGEGLDHPGLWRRLKSWVAERFGSEEAEALLPGGLLGADAPQSRATPHGDDATPPAAARKTDDPAPARERPAEGAARSPAEDAAGSPAEGQLGDGPREGALSSARRPTLPGHGSAPPARRDAERAGPLRSGINAPAAGSGEDAPEEPAAGDGEAPGEDPAARLAARERQLAAREARLRAAEEAARRQGIVAFVEQQVAAGRVLPRDRDGLVTVLSAVPGEATVAPPVEAGAAAFAEEDSADDDTLSLSAPEWFRQWLSRQPAQVDYAEWSGAGEEEGGGGFAVPPGFGVDPAALELHRRATAHASRHGIPYPEAVRALTHS